MIHILLGFAIGLPLTFIGCAICSDLKASWAQPTLYWDENGRPTTRR